MLGAGYAGRHRERAEAVQRAASSRRRRSGGPTLSALLAQQPSSYDGRKISAVDKSIESLDALPDRYAAVKTLYLSKNALRSLAGVEQFHDLKALSAADNLLSDLDCLRALPAASISLEAASFEGNPMADLPNYRAHVIHILGPSLAVLDNRTVSPEERAAAAGAVAHESTMLALMLSNACLVHKLGRAVQVVRLHCELQCAVLSGQYGGAGVGAGAAAAANIVCGGRCASRMLQLWDYEGTLGRQERHAIGLAIRREVGRRYRKIVAAGGKPEGSSRLWQQAFAQVMLLQQETIASLMGMLEQAKADAAGALAPLIRPPSPSKRAALKSDAEAQERVRQDREALIQELRDAFLGLAEASAHANAPQEAAQFEARIRELHAALEAAGDSSGPSPAPPSEWSIQAVRHQAPVPNSPSAAAAPPQRPSSSTALKSALKQQRPASSGGWSPARPGAVAAAARSAAAAAASAARGSRPASARPVGSAALPHAQAAQLPRPSTAPSNDQQQPQQQHVGMRPPPQKQQQRWQADDGLAEYESMEQARGQMPRPFQGGNDMAGQQPAAGSSPANLPPSSQASPMRHLLPQALLWAGADIQVDAAFQQQHVQQPHQGGGLPSHVPSRPASASRDGSPLRSRPASPERPYSGNPSQWTPNPLARSSSSNGRAPGSDSPQRQGLQGVFQLLQREGRVTQVEALKTAIAQYETTAAELQAGNHQLAEALQQVQQHAQELETQLAAQRRGVEEQRAAVDSQRAQAEAEQQRQAQQLEELGQKLEEVLAARATLQAQLQAGAEEQQRQLQAAAAERDAAASEAARSQSAAAAMEQRLLARVAELEGRKLVHLSLTVQSREAEWQSEAARAATLEERNAELTALLATHRRQERLASACTRLAARAVLRRAVLWWRQAAAESAYLTAKRQQAEELHRRALLARWLAAWQLATHRSKLLDACERERQRRNMLRAWQAWRAYCQDCVLHRGLDAAASLHRQSALLRQCFAVWQGQAAACCQIELPDAHPAMQAAVELQRMRLLRSFFGAWRQHMAEHVLPRLAVVQLRVLEQFMGSQRRAFAAWQQYVEHRREGRLLKAAAQQHRLQQLFQQWRAAAHEEKELRAATVRAAFTSQQLVLRRGWRAWRLAVQEKKELEQGCALADQHLRRKLLTRCWSGWQEWTGLCCGMNQRQAARLQARTFGVWRQAAKAAEKRRLAEAFDQRRRRRRFRAALAAWRTAAAAKQAQQHQLARVRALLRRGLLCRVLSGWRRAALAGKLYQTLAVVHHLQLAVERARDELEHKAEQIDALNSVRFEVEGTSGTLSLQVSSMDSDLAAAQRQAAELQAAAHAAQLEHEAAAAALEQALVAQAAAEAEGIAAAEARDAAMADREDAEAAKAAACRARQAAERQAAGAEERAEAAAAAAVAASARADAAAASLEELKRERESLASRLEAAQAERAGLAAELDLAKGEACQMAVQLAKLEEERDQLLQRQETAQGERAGLAAQLEQVQGEARLASALLADTEEERDRLRRQRDNAEQAVLTAAAEQQAALKQAERLTQLCEEQQQQCQRLQQQVLQLQGSLGSQSALQSELHKLSKRNEQLQADNSSMQGQLERFAAAMERAEGDSASLQAAAEAAAAEQRRLQERCQAAEAEVQRLGRLADSLRASQASTQAQLQRAQAEAEQAAALQGELTAAVEELTAQRGSLAAQKQEVEAQWGEERAANEAQWAEERAGLEASVEQLQSQLLASNDVLESCRRMLGDSCSARSAADHQTASLTELLRSVKAELLLKDASIKSLSRENAQRAERLRALQAQVTALSQQSAVEGDCSAVQRSQQLYAGCAPALSPRAAAWAAAPSSSGWARSGQAAAAPTRPASPAAGLCMGARAASGEEPSFSSGLAHGLLTPQGAGTAGAAAAGVPNSYGSFAASSAASFRQQHPQQFNFPSRTPGSPAPSFISLPSQHAWQHTAGSGGSPGGSAGVSTGGSPRPVTAVGATVGSDEVAGELASVRWQYEQITVDSTRHRPGSGI